MSEMNVVTGNTGVSESWSYTALKRPWNRYSRSAKLLLRSKSYLLCNQCRIYDIPSLGHFLLV